LKNSPINKIDFADRKHQYYIVGNTHNRIIFILQDRNLKETAKALNDDIESLLELKKPVRKSLGAIIAIMWANFSRLELPLFT